MYHKGDVMIIAILHKVYIVVVHESDSV